MHLNNFGYPEVCPVWQYLRPLASILEQPTNKCMQIKFCVLYSTNFILYSCYIQPQKLINNSQYELSLWPIFLQVLYKIIKIIICDYVLLPNFY